MIITVSNYIHLVMKEVEGLLNSFTYPVFIKAENDRPDLIASSVIISLDSRVFLITAAHVLDDVAYVDSAFYIGLDGSLIEVNGKFIRSINLKKDHFDIAFSELSYDFVIANKINVLSQDKLMIK